MMPKSKAIIKFDEDDGDRPNFKGAPCTYMDPELFFPDEHGKPDARAELACALCKLRTDCLTYATKHNFDGYWGGTMKSDRKALTRKYERVKCPGCRSEDIMEDRNAGVCLACGLSWPI